MKKFLKFIILLLFVLLFTGCRQKKPEYISKTDFKLNTVVTVSLYDRQEQQLLDNCMALCDRYEKIFSRTMESSELYQLNKTKSMEVSDELLQLISLGISCGEQTEGLFDITIAPLSTLWDFSGEEHLVPSREDLDEALESVDYRNVLLEGNHVTLLNDASIDLGALAKGYIADRMKDYLLSEGVQSALINLGGNILCIGQKPDGSAFQVGIQKPFAHRNETAGAVSVTDRSLVSSGIYERGFEADGVWYHHILDPATGYPVSSDLTGVTILSDRSVQGDMLSTICLSLGKQKAREFLKQFPGTQAWLIDESGTVTEVTVPAASH